MRTVHIALVFKQSDKLSPRRILLVPTVSIRSKHTLNVQVLHKHGIVLLDEPRRYFVLVVQYFPVDVAFGLRHFDSLILVVVRPMFFPREFAVRTSESFVFAFEIELIHGLPVAGMDVVQDAEVNTHAVARVE
ncbi:hypothetical protein C442_09724 [Haloarcula amylolytica JCM 13557]|uniref:Uncharacterized protein n=1 Tax=Haloarcula amylolytica JCM 13557 TaxID=1227452 RepID=M0KPC0_9EURY|nr:hypothetical protein C442_09724 [Haloarcula amylolytica JCM 13557]